MTSAWAFAVAAWTRPGVEAICLELQNRHGQSPLLLLWRCWTLAEHKAVGPEVLAGAIAITRAWDEDVLEPLRTIRRRWAAPAELEAEHALLDALEVLADAGGARGEASPHWSLIDLAEAWRPRAPAALLVQLAETIRRAL